MKRNIEMDYIWYVGYGSNLSEQRFLCYIRGGTPRFGKKHNNGCKNKTIPLENKPIIIHYPLYFALPSGNKETSNWGLGGVAFVSPHKNEKSKTYCRMWRITKEQYDEVRNQEGRSWYGKEMLLGEDGGVPICTITNEVELNNIILPSDAYIKTIAIGLQETYNFNDKKIVNYLMEKDGIKDYLKKDEILKMIASL